MKPFTQIFLLIGVGVFFSGCRKDPNPTKTDYVQGVIYDASTHKGAPNALVELWVDYNSGSSNIQFYDDLLGSTYTDSTGLYYLEFRGKQTSIYGVFPIKKNYFNNDQVSNFSMGNHNVNYNLWPKSWIHFHLKNTQPVSNFDTLVFNASHLFIGMSVDTSFYDSIPANLPPVYTWVVKKNGNSVGNIWYASCASFDTCQFNIFY